MPYRYFTASSPIYFDNASNAMRFEFQSTVDALFYDATSVYTIQEEAIFGSGSYVNVDVRINQAVDRQTGNKLGNDFKQIIFKDLDHTAGLGYKYNFDNNIWVTVNLEVYKGLARSSVLRRCNATLRWTDAFGNIFSEPCAIDYELNRARDEIGSQHPITPQGYVDVYCQLNARTRLIKANQRFLFGPVENRIPFKVFGNGVRNFLNETTADDTSCPLLVLTMGASFENANDDDLVNGIADYYQNVYVLSVSPSAIAGNIGDSIQLIASLTRNGDAISLPLTYQTSASTVVSVSSSGLVNPLASGSATLTISMTDNLSVTDTVAVNVSASPVTTEEVRVSPTGNILYENQTQIYTATLYVDGVAQADTFAFTLANSLVPVANYTLNVLDGNSFSLTNEAFYLSAPLSVVCTSGSYSKQIDIYLRGGW